MFRGRANKGWPQSGDRRLVKSGVDDGIGIEGVLGEETVPQDMGENCLQVVGVNGGLTVEQGMGTGGGLQGESSAYGDSMVLTCQRPGRLAESQEITLQGVGDGKFRDLLLESDQILQAQDGGNVILAQGSVAVEFENIELTVLRRQGHRDGEEETVQLRLGQGEGSRGRGVVLGSHHQKGIGELFCFSVDGNLPLVHGLEKGGLGAGRGAVDFVCQKEVGEDRPRNELELTILLAVEIVTDDVGGKQIRGKLEALEDAADRSGKDRGQGGLSDPGRARHESMAPGEEGREEKVGRLLGAQNGIVERPAERLKGIVRHGDELLAKPGGENGKFPEDLKRCWRFPRE